MPTIQDLIVEVISEQFTDKVFSLEELCVACWKKHPDRFGIKSYRDQYPDNNKVLVALSGQKGLIGRGYVQRLGRGLLSIGFIPRRQARA